MIKPGIYVKRNGKKQFSLIPQNLNSLDQQLFTHNQDLIGGHFMIRKHGYCIFCKRQKAKDALRHPSLPLIYFLIVSLIAHCLPVIL